MLTQFTPEEIDQLKAGREMDILIAEHVLGWTSIDKTNDVGQDFIGLSPEDRRDSTGCSYVPRYSTELADAWLVVEKTHMFLGRLYQGEEYGLTLQQNVSGEWVVKHRSGMDIVRADTAPLAICQTVLKLI